MPLENGVDWRPIEPEKRGRHATFASAVAAAAKDLATERNPFFDALVDNWARLFPDAPMRPGRCDRGKIVLYVRSAPAFFAARAKLPAVRRVLATLPGAPARIEFKLEHHT